METLVGIAIGIGLSAACGFRIFVPLLVMNVAVLGGQVHLSSEFEWLGTTYATLVFTTATIAEIIGYYIPWFDSILDIIATPAAVIAGTVATASMVTDISPLLKWTLAIIAGGGIAGLIQGSTVALRTKSSLLQTGFKPAHPLGRASMGNRIRNDRHHEHDYERRFWSGHTERVVRRYGRRAARNRRIDIRVTGK